MNNPEGIKKMSETKRELSRTHLVEKAADAAFVQSKVKLAVSGNRRKRHIGFEEYKKMLADGISVTEIVKMTSKHLVYFYNAILNGKITLAKDDFERMYCSGMSLDEIAEKLGMSRDHITHLREFYGIKRKGATFIRRLSEEKPLSQEAKSMLVGSVLGDCHIHQLGYFSEKHSAKQVEYLEWKASLVPDILSPRAFTSATSVDKRSGNTIYSFSLRTRAHSFLYDLRKKFYAQRNSRWFKVIPDNIGDILDESALAVWFMDDGSTDWGYRHEIKNGNTKPRSWLCSESFSVEDNERLKSVLTKKWGLEVEVGTREIRSKFSVSRLIFSKKGTQDLHLLIAEKVNPCLRYKICENDYVLSRRVPFDPVKIKEEFDRKHSIII